MRKRTASLILVICVLLCLLPISASASNAYTINGATVRYDDFLTVANQCWPYANNFYEKVWGVEFTNAFDDPDNILRNLSDDELTMTADHLEAYVKFAVPGAVLRICDEEYLHGSDIWGHSLFIVSIDDKGFTVFEGGQRLEPYCRERYYTWDSLVGSYTYAYIKYIKWPGSTEYTSIDFLKQPESVNTVEGTTVHFTAEAQGENLQYQWQWRAGGSGWADVESDDSQTNTLSIEATAQLHGRRYRCVVTSPNGSMGFSSDAVLSVTGFVTHPQSQTVLEETVAQFQVEAAGDGLHYQWQWRRNSDDEWEDLVTTTEHTNVLSLLVTLENNGWQYRCRITDQYGTSCNSDGATLTVAEKKPATIITQPKNASAQIGSIAAFTVDATGDGLTYQWQWLNAAGEWVTVTSAGYNTDTLTVEATGSRNGYQYRCKISDDYGNEIYSDPVTLTVLSDLTITKQPESVIAMVGDTATFTVEASGSGLNYQWQWLNAAGVWTNTTADGYNTNTIIIPAEPSRKGYQYRCMITDEVGNIAYSDAATLMVTTENEATIIRQPESVVAPIGSTVTFSVEATGDELVYQWEFRKSANEEWAITTIAGSKTNSIAVAATTTRDGYQYRCVISDIVDNIVYSEPATLTIDRQSMAAILRQPESVSVAVGSTVQFTVEATGVGLSYQWEYRKNADAPWEFTSVDGYLTDTITVEATLARNGYQYRCKVWDQDGNTAYSEGATLTVAQQIQTSITRQPVSVTAAVDSTAVFSVEAVGEQLSYQWQWLNASGEWVNTTTAGYNTDTITVDAAITRNGNQYRCKITDGYGNEICSDAATLTVLTEIVITGQPASVTVFVGDSASFTVAAEGFGLTYQWQWLNAAGVWTNTTATGYNTATITIPAETFRNGYQYRCVITDEVGNTACSEPATLIVTTKNVATIVKQPASVSAAIGSSVNFRVEATGDELTYQWQYRKNSSSAWEITTVSGAKTNSIVIEATNTRNGYQYRCVITDAAGNEVISEPAVLTIDQQSVAAITSHPESVSVSVGSTAHFTVEATGKDLSYQWQYRKNDSGTWGTTTVTGNKTASITVEATMTRNGYQYRCKVTDAGGNVVYSDGATLTVAQQMATTITAQPVSVTAPVGNTVNFSVSATGEQLTYQWQWLNSSGKWTSTTATGCRTNTMSVEATAARNGYQYRCKITDGYGNVVYSDAATLTVTTSLSVTKHPVSVNAAVGESVQFSVEASGSGNLTYLWQWRKGSTGTWATTTVTGYKTNTLTVQATGGRNGYQYRCKISDNYGNVTYSDAAALTISSKLEIVSQPKNVVAKVNTDVTFTVQVAGTDVRYQWQWLNGAGTWVSTSASGYNTDSITVQATAARNGYQYRCKISDSSGNVLYSEPAGVTIAATLIITGQPENATTALGDYAAFTVTVEGTEVCYQWQWLNGSGNWVNTSTSGYNTDTLTVQATADRDGYQYRCRITDVLDNEIYSDVVTLTVFSNQEITVQPEDVRTSYGSTATFHVAVSGGNVYYQWQYLNDAGLWVNTIAEGSQTDTLTVEAVGSRNGNQYRCKISSNYGDVLYSDIATLIVTSALEITEQPENATVVLGDTATFRVMVNGADVHYRWQYLNDSGFWVNTTVPGYTTDTIQVEAIESRNGNQYRCRITDDYGNLLYSEVVSLTITSRLEITAQPQDVSAELGSTVSFHVAATGANVYYRWQYLNDNGLWVSTTATGYRTDTITLEATGARNGNQYRCRISDDYGNVIYSDIATLTITSNLEITAQPQNVSAELGSTVSFRVAATGANVYYRWQYLNDNGLWVSTTATGYRTDTITLEATGARNGNQYRCRISDDYGNVIYSDIATLTITSNLEITAQPQDVRAELGSTVSFRVAAKGADVSYRWQYLNDAGMWVNTTATGYRTDTITLEATDARNGYLYRCRITDNYGNLLYSEAAELTVTSSLTITSQPEDVIAAAGETAVFCVSVDGNSVRYQWQWQNNAGEWVNTTASGYNTNSLSVEATRARNGYQYRCCVSDTYGNLIYSDAVTLTVV